MKIKALILSLGILGTSSVAMARPVHSYSVGGSLSFGTSSPGPVVRDHRSNSYPVRMPVRHPEWRNDDYRPQPRVLGQDLNFGDTQYRKDIVPGAQRSFGALQLQSNGGSTYIMKVVIEFADGGVQRIDVNRTLRGYQAITLDLDGDRRALHRILVYRADGGEALNMNSRHYGDFSVIGL